MFQEQERRGRETGPTRLGMTHARGGSHGIPKKRSTSHRGRFIALVASVCVVAALVPAGISWAANTNADYSWYTADPGASTFTLSDGGDWLGFVDLVNGTADTDRNGVVDAADAGAQTFAGKTIVLGASLNLSGASVQPAGGQGSFEFDGTLDGNGKTIDNFKLDTTGGTTNVGLIGKAGSASVIRDLTVGNSASCTITEDAAGSAVANVGMLAGDNEGSISGCTNNGTLSISSAVVQTTDVLFPVRNIGGLAGICSGDISSCTNAGAVSVSESSAPLTSAEQPIVALNVGGVVGSAGAMDSTVDPSTSKAHGSVSGCVNTGRVTVDTPSQSGVDRFGNTVYAQSSNVGGIAGYSRSSISACSNSAYIDAVHANGIGGVVGNVRAKTTTSSYSGNFTQEGSDDGASGDVLAITGCTNSGDVNGYAFSAGIVGRSGSYVDISSCLNKAGTFVVGTRATKPFPAGIVGSTYGTVSYCANLGTVVSGNSFDESAKTYSTGGGYYAAGIAGNTSYFTDAAGVRTTPLPEVYGCYNAGSIYALDNMRQRALVGDNAGYVHDNLALANCVSTNKLVYGDSAGDQETSGGTVKGNLFVTSDQLKADAVIDGATGSTSVTVLNASAANGGWTTYWVKDISGTAVNGGYPALNSQVTVSGTDITGATVVLKANAQYTGLAAVPTATVTTAEGVTLVQNADFKVVPQSDAVEVTATGTTPYTATIVGIGNYSGTATQELSYGIDKGDLADCTVTVNAKEYNASAQTPDASDVHVYNLAGTEVASSEYTFALTAGDANLTDGQAIDARKYGITITAAGDSAHFTGTNTSGVFSIKTAKIICEKDSVAGNYAQPDGISFQGANSVWFSQTLHPNAVDSELTTFEYTGHPINPAVTGVTFGGTTNSTIKPGIALTAGTDYRVVYGQTAIDSSTTSTTSDNTGTARTGDVDTSAYGYIMVRYVAGSNFSNYEIMKFRIVDTAATNDIAGATIEGDGDIIYESGSYTPITVWYGGSQLTEGSDYTISYTDNDAIGTATYTITGIGANFSGTRSGTFKLVSGTPYTFNYTYDETAHTATVTGVTYNGSKATFDMVIPGTVEKDGVTYTVIAIADKAFGSNSTSEITDSDRRIASVTIPATVTSIGQFAFAATDISKTDLSNIATVTFADGSQLTSIGKGAFYNAAVTSLKIPAGVSTIDASAFRNCTDLTTVVFDSTSATLPSMQLNSFLNDNNVAATCYASATAVRDYVTTTIASQGWTLTVLDGPAPSTYAVSFAAGDGATGTVPTMDAQTAGANITLPAATGLSKADATFTGWLCSVDGRTYAAGADYTMTAAATTFTAQWTATPSTDWFTVNVVASDGTTSSKTYTKSAFEALASDSSDPVSGLYYKSGWQVGTAASYVTLPTLIADAGGTASWTTGSKLSYAGKSGDQSWSYADVMGGMFYPATGANSTDVTGGTSVTPVLAITYGKAAVTTDAAAAQTAAAASATTTGEPTMVFGTTEAAYLAQSSSGMRLWNGLAQITITAPVTVTFDTQGGGTVAPQTITSNTSVTVPDAPTFAAHTFGGWYADQSCTTPIDLTTATFAKDTTVYAKWTRDLPVISAATANGGTYGYPAGTVSASVTATAPAGGTLTGYQWYTTDQTGSAGSAIAGATGATYELPTGRDAGDYYFYCVVTADGADGQPVSATSAPIHVVVGKAASALAFPTTAVASTSDSSIIMNAATASAGDGAITYAIAKEDTVPVDPAVWQTSTTFTGLDAGTTYYVFARIAETTNHSAATTVGVQVATKTTGVLVDPTLPSITYDPKATLADVALPTVGNGVWTWADDSKTPTVTNTGYAAVFTPDDSTTVEYSGVEGYDPATGTIVRTLALTVDQAHVTLEAPAAAAITYGKTLADSALTGGSATIVTPKGTTMVSGTFTWKVSTTVPRVGDSGSTAFTVVFTPDDDANYASGEMDITLTVNPKDVSDPSVTTTIVIADRTYSGSAIVPDATVTVDGRVLVAGTDYDLSATDNVDPGSASYTITFKGDYAGTKTGTFAIKALHKVELVDNSGTGVSQSGLDGVLAAVVAANPDAKSVVVTFDVGVADASSAPALAIKGLAGATGLTFDRFYDVKLLKNVDGTVMDIGSDNDVLIAASYPFDFAGKDQVRVFVYHDGVAEELTTSPNSFGEYVEFDRAASRVIVHAKRFSTYAIGYTVAPDAGIGEGGSTGSGAGSFVKTGDAVMAALPWLAGAFVLALIALAAGLVVSRRSSASRTGRHSR